VAVASRPTLCDGVQVPYVTHELFDLLRGLVDSVALVDEATVRRAVAALALKGKVVVEGSAALALAAALNDDDVAGRGAAPVAVVTGGSIEPAVFVDILKEALPP